MGNKQWGNKQWETTLWKRPLAAVLASDGSVLLTDLGQHHLTREVRRRPSQMCGPVLEWGLVRQGHLVHASLLG